MSKSPRGRDARERLPADLHALAHLGDAHEIAVVDVAVRSASGRGSRRSRSRDTGTSCARRSATPIARAIGPDQPVAGCDPPARSRRRPSCASARSGSSSAGPRTRRSSPGNMSRNVGDGVVEARRQILAQAADPDVAREHAEAGDQLVDVQDAARGRVRQYISTETAPTSSACVPRLTRWLRDPLQLDEQDADVLHAPASGPRRRAAARPTGRTRASSDCAAR